jgi:NAD(P)-dependent dehydrogenase (short-subunit alcohol dehydrogenase family)
LSLFFTTLSDYDDADDASYITGETVYVDGGRRVLNYVFPVKA